MPTLLLGNSRNSRLHQMTRFYSPGSPLRAPPPLFCPLGRRSAAGREALCVEVRTCHSALQSPPPPPGTDRPLRSDRPVNRISAGSRAEAQSDSE